MNPIMIAAIALAVALLYYAFTGNKPWDVLKSTLGTGTAATVKSTNTALAAKATPSGA